MATNRDLLQGTHARRLVRQPQGWTLEVECLVRRNGAVYRPSVRRIQGIEVILHHLQAVRAERLAAHARQLMDEMQPDNPDEHSFEPVNDEWIPSSLLKTDPPAFGAEEDPKLTQKLAAIERENRTLKARLAQIESMITSDAEASEASHHGSPSPMPRGLSEPPPANEQTSDVSPLAYQGTMVLPNGRPDLRRPIPLEPIEEPAGLADEHAEPTGLDALAPASGDDSQDAASGGYDDADAGVPAAGVPAFYDPNEGAEDDPFNGPGSGEADLDA